MNAPARLTQGFAQRTRWAQALAILLGIAPIYAMTIVTHLNRDQPYSLDDILFYTCVIAGLALVALLLLLRFVSHYLHDALQIGLVVYLMRVSAM